MSRPVYSAIEPTVTHKTPLGTLDPGTAELRKPDPGTSELGTPDPGASEPGTPDPGDIGTSL